MSLQKSLGWMGLAQVCFVLTQFGGSVVLARVLSPYEMGVFAFAASVVGMISLIQAFGLAEFIISQPKLDDRTLAGAFTVNAGLALLLVSVVLTLGLFGGRLFNDDGVRRVLFVIGVLPLIGVFEFRPGALMQREAQFKALALINITRHTTATAVTIILALRGWSYMSIAYGQAAGSIVATSLINLVGRRHVSLRLSTGEWRPLMRFGLQMIAINGVNSLAGRIGEFALGRLLGLSALGLYSRAQSLFSLVWNNIHAAVGGVLLTDFSEQQRQGRSLRDSYLKAVAMLTGLLWPAFLGLGVLAAPLIEIVYGPKWIGAALPLTFLCVSAVPLVAITMTWEVFIASRQTAIQARIEAYHAVIGLGLFVGGSLISLSAAAASRIGDSVVTYVMYRPHLERMTDTTFSDFTAIYMRSAIVTFAGIAPACALVTYFGGVSTVPPVLVFGSVAIGIGLWIAAMRLTNHPLLTEILAIARRRFSRAA